MTSGYLHRGLEARLIEAVGSSPVVVIEGARAVGKTWMCDELVSRGHLATRVSLTDDTVRAQTRQDLRGWLRSLPTPAVIDEAQIVAELPLAVKDVVDLRGTSGQFVLTGSSSIGRTGLGGTDPLAGRHVRLMLRPLAQIELRSAALPGDTPRPNVVDVLFDHDLPDHGTIPVADRTDLISRMRRGGFPRYATETGTVRLRLQAERISADIEATLADGGLGAERFDVYLVRRVLDAVAGVPGGILNMSVLGSQLELDRRTVDRYLDILQRRFLVHRLANLSARPRAQGTARPKIHPLDVSVSAAVLDRAGRRIDQQPEAFGQLLESMVVNELMAQSAWSSLDPRPFFWRHARGRGDDEVDLVLVDTMDRRVGVEVKASTSVSERDAAGLRALRSMVGVHRGFVVYLGDGIFELDAGIWALPVEFLAAFDAWPSGAARASDDSVAQIETERVGGDAVLDSPEATVFVSYVHSDDQTEGGAISRFVTDLADRYEFLFGGRLEVFADRQDPGWAGEWERHLTEAIERTAFLLAVVTPRFMRNEHCRDEVISFSTHARRVGEPGLLLPLVWRMPPELREAPLDDPVVSALGAAQWADIGELRYADPSAGSYRRKLDELAERLHETASRVSRSGDKFAGPGLSEPTQAFAAPEPATGPLDDLDDAEKLAELAQAWLSAVNHLVAEFTNMVAVLGALGSPPQMPSARSARAWVTRAANVLAEPADRLNAAADSMRRAWAELDQVISQVISGIHEMPTLAGRPGVDDFLHAIRELPATLNERYSAGTDDALRAMNAVTRMSRQLRPFAQVLRAAHILLGEMRSAARAWSAQAGVVSAAGAVGTRV